MHKLILSFSLVCCMLLAYGQQNKKPRVLIYGDDMLAFAAAMQSAKSNVPTLWLLSGKTVAPELNAAGFSIANLPNLDGGIWMEVLMELAGSAQKRDSLARELKQHLDPVALRKAMHKLMDQQPNLQLLTDNRVQLLKRNKNTWTVTLSDKQKFTIWSILDASPAQELHQYIGSPSMLAKPAGLMPIAELQLGQLKSLLAAGQSGDLLYGLTMGNMIYLEKYNMLNLHGVAQLLDDNPSTIPLKAHIGQAMGAIVAYLAFFKTDAVKLDIRKVQTELLSYGARIVPYQDVMIEDPNFTAIQKIGLTNLFKAVGDKQSWLFKPDSSVSFAEVKPIFNQYYTRSQLWFMDNQGEFFNWKSFFSLIKFVGLRGEEIEKQIQQNWSSKLKFAGVYNEEQQVTRYQFATILELYASPYVRAINHEGQPIY